MTFRDCTTGLAKGALAVLVALVVVGCASATQPTPQIIFVTPSAPPETSSPTPALAATASQRPPTEPQPTEPQPIEPQPTATATPSASATPRLDEPGELEIVEHGFTNFPRDDYAHYGVVIMNTTGAGWLGFGGTLEVNFLDASGSLLTTSDQPIGLVLPDQVTAVGDVEFDTRDGASLEVRITRQPEWERIDYTTGTLTFSDVNTRTGRSGDSITTGRVQSEFVESDEPFVTIIAIYRNESGEIVGGDSDLIDLIEHGAERSFRIDPLGRLDIAETEMYYLLSES